MTWDPAILNAEIAREFGPYQLNYAALVDAIWLWRIRKLSKKTEERERLRQSAIFRAHELSVQRAYRRRLQSIESGTSRCVACGKEFSVSLWKRLNGRDKCCSLQCVMIRTQKCIATLYTVNGERLTAKQLSEKYRVPQITIYKRINRGLLGSDLVAPIGTFRRRMPHAIPVRCEETGVVYCSMQAAADALGVSVSSVAQALKRGSRCAGHRFVREARSSK